MASDREDEASEGTSKVRVSGEEKVKAQASVNIRKTLTEIKIHLFSLKILLLSIVECFSRTLRRLVAQVCSDWR